MYHCRFRINMDPSDQFNPHLSGTISDYEWNNIDDFSCTPTKMMHDHSLISDSPIDSIAYDLSDPLLMESGVGGGLKTQGLEVIIASADVIINSDVQSVVEVSNDMESHLVTDQFGMESSIEMGGISLEDQKLVIDTEEFNFEDNSPNDSFFACSECGVMFKREASLRKHRKNEHLKGKRSKSKKNSSKEIVVFSNKRYNCPSCGYSSQRRDKLDRHMERHVLIDGVHPCGKPRHKPEALPQRHRHNAEEYRCQFCSYSATVMKAFKKHQKVHLSSNADPTPKISCKICGKDRTTESEMQKHMKKHRKDDYFCCDICSFSSVQLKKIIQHRRMHTGEKPHLCPHCTYRSARRDNLRSHVRRMHKRQNMYIDTFNPKEDTLYQSH